MKTSDLRKSNAIYILRSIIETVKTAEEIANECEMSLIAVKRILYNLCNNQIVYKYNDKIDKVGRPKTYFGLNPKYHCTLIRIDSGYFVIEAVNVLGDVILNLEIPLDVFGLKRNPALRIVRGNIRNHSLKNYNLSTFFIVDDDFQYDNLSSINQFNTKDFILSSLKNEETTIFVQIFDKKYLYNYGKIKEVNHSIEEIEEIIDIDTKFILTNDTKIEILHKILRLHALNLIEEKI